jgi:DNA mismatch repair protein MutL
MSNSIRVLPKEVFEKIAAGEVVTGPSAVVKELVENSIDAGANAISVHIEEGGKRLIRISDSGRGITPDELELAVFPHATSKIESDENLDEIRTLGFRGEALASISAVSKLTITSRTKGRVDGASIRSAGGDTSAPVKTGAPEGTAVSVEDLFFNVPARRKFLKSDRAETSQIIDFVARMAVAWPNIRFSMSHNDVEDFSTPGSGDVISAIVSTAGITAASGMLPVNAESESGDMRISAYISPPDIDRKTRKNQYYFVNGRSVSDQSLTDAVSNAYKGFIFEGRFPVIYLFLEINPTLVDVNVHPSKIRIRFSDKDSVFAFVESAVAEALRENGSTAKIRSAKQAKLAKREENRFFSLKETEGNENQPNFDNNFDFVREDDLSAVDIYAPDDDSQIETVSIGSLWDGENPQLSSSGYDPRIHGEAESDAAPINSAITESMQSRETQNVTAITELDATPKPIGRIFGLYVLARTAETFYIIDQHAAHERINYEKLLAQFNAKDKLTQGLLTPLIVSIPAAAGPYAGEWAEKLSDFGFETDEFGDKTFAVRAFPAFLSFEESESFLSDILENAGGKPPGNSRAMERLISRACHASIKLNDALTDEESAALIDELFACENPYTCPHGRPVFIELTRAELDKMFKRDM